MMKLTTLCALVIAVTTTAARADRQKHEEKFCSSLGAVNADLAQLEALGPSSTVGELRAQVAQIEKDGKTVGKEARKIKSATSKQLVDATEQLYRDVRSLSDSMTLAQARSRIDGDLQAVKRNAQALATESGCPDAMPDTPTGGSSTSPLEDEP